MIQLDLTPDPETPFFSLQTTIDGRDYDFDFAWNDRRSAWVLTMKTTAGEILFASQVLRHGRNLLSRCTSPNAPSGALFVWCNTPSDLSPPGVGDLGGRAGVYYATVDEL
jgi:uncharacterized protein DUF6983